MPYTKREDYIMAGIKESLDVVDVLKKVASIISDVKSDGVINFWDVIHLVKLYKSVSIAIENSEKIKSELLDLDVQEKNMLIQEMQDAIFLLLKAFK
jgi:hypothetical protein